MKLSDEGVEFITSHEGCKLNPYKDVAGLWTIGVGHLITSDELGELLRPISYEEAVQLLKEDVEDAEQGVLRNVKVPLSQFEFDSLVSFVFNVGCGAFAKSTLLKELNNGNKEKAAEQFGRWNKAGGKEVKGLTKRRKSESILFISGNYNHQSG